MTSDLESKPILKALDEDSTKYLSLLKETKKLLKKQEKIFCRESEILEITTFWKKCLENKKGGSLYISGSPGTGKTATLAEITESMKAIKHQKIIHINCFEISPPSAIFVRLHQCLLAKKSSSVDNPIQSIQAYLTSPKTKNIM